MVQHASTLDGTLTAVLYHYHVVTLALGFQVYCTLPKHTGATVERTHWANNPCPATLLAAVV